MLRTRGELSVAFTITSHPLDGDDGVQRQLDKVKEDVQEISSRGVARISDVRVYGPSRHPDEPEGDQWIIDICSCGTALGARDVWRRNMTRCPGCGGYPSSKTVDVAVVRRVV